MKFAVRVACMLLLSSSGCSYMGYTVANVYACPVNAIDELVFLCKLHRLARSAFDKVQAEHPEKAYSKAYKHGFVHGFVDYVDRNGGEPPAIPPYHLQRSALRDLDKQSEMEQWFAGFRHGVRVAQESGLREKVLVPISLPPQETNVAMPPEFNNPTFAPPEQQSVPQTTPLPMPQQQLRLQSRPVPQPVPDAEEVIWKASGTLPREP